MKTCPYCGQQHTDRLDVCDECAPEVYRADEVCELCGDTGMVEQSYGAGRHACPECADDNEGEGIE